MNKPFLKIAEIVTDFNDQIILISLKNNLGFAYANNRAIELVLNIGDAKFLWLLNNDTKVARNALRSSGEFCVRLQKEKAEDRAYWVEIAQF